MGPNSSTAFPVYYSSRLYNKNGVYNNLNFYNKSNIRWLTHIGTTFNIIN